MYRVIRDDREKKGQGWFFDEGAACEGTVIDRLKTGDYSIEGLEHRFAIERKGSLGEFFGNLTQARFERELVRLNDMDYPFVILEFTYEDILKFPHTSGIPHNYWQSILNKYKSWKSLEISGPKFINSKLKQFRLKYPNIMFLLVGDDGKIVAEKLMRIIYGSAKEELGS